MKPYEVTVTYRLHAQDENDAVGQVLNHRVEPETIDVLDLPTRKKLDLDLIPF